MTRQFDWDLAKERTNVRKHGVSFLEALTVFNDPYLLSTYDIGHSVEEDRWVVVGLSYLPRIILVVYTIPIEIDGFEFIRLISARKATFHERESYSLRRPI